jgi:hypothetical protein
MFEFILSRLHPRPERRGFTLHMDKYKQWIHHSRAWPAPTKVRLSIELKGLPDC